MTVPRPVRDEHDDNVDPRFLPSKNKKGPSWPGGARTGTGGRGLAVPRLHDRFGLPGARRLPGVPLILLGGPFG